MTGRLTVGVVLAGGRSLRMGVDKAMLAWRGRPLIEHQIRLLRDVGLADVRISGARPDYRGVPDAVTGIGPLGGLTGVAAALADGVELLVVPVDMPLLTVALLRRLLAERPRAPGLRFAGRVLPMRWRLDAASRAELGRLAGETERRRRSLRALQQACAMEEIALAGKEAELLLDCNSMEAWNGLQPR